MRNIREMFLNIKKFYDFVEFMFGIVIVYYWGNIFV